MIASSTYLDNITPQFMQGVTDQELDIIRGLIAVWAKKRPRNVLRSVYFDAKMPFRDLGIGVPPQILRKVKAAVGWPAKAVTKLAERSVFDAFVAPNSTTDPFEISALLDDNRFDLELPQAIESAYKHSCAFMTTTLGDTASGDPDVLIMARSAEWSAGTWDKKRRVVSAMLAITDVDQDGHPTGMDVLLPDVVLICRRRPSGAWVTSRQENPLGEVLAEPLAWSPQLDRPFGRSRISRPVMAITDNAIRSVVRGEGAAEFFAAPRMLALGVSEDAFKSGKWQAAIDRWFAIGRDEEGELPKVEQLPQMTMQPLIDHYRMYATQFAGETDLPISALGIVQDNPPSAEALYAAEKDLIVAARASNRVLGAALRRVAQRAVMLRDGDDEISNELRGLRPTWVNPAFTSPTTAVQALNQLVTVFPWMAETDDALRYAGFEGPEITRMKSDRTKSAGGGVLERILAGQTQVADPAPAAAAPPQTASGDDPTALKAKFDALGTAIRAGVDPADAAARLGLAGIKFTGATPVALRLPKDDADQLEER